MSALKRRILAFALGCVGVGIICIMISIGYAKDRKTNNTSNRNESMSDVVEKVDSLKLSIDFGTVILMTGDEFSIRAKRIWKDQITSEVEDGCWVISDNGIDLEEESFYPFGHLAPYLTEDFNIGKNGPEIVITVPKEFQAENLSLHLGAGELIADELFAKKAKLEVGAGLMEINRMTVDGFISLETGTGKIDVESLKSQSARFDCGMGSIEVEGEIPSDIEAECGIGELKLDLLGNERDYNYDIDCGIGEVSINQNTYGGTDHRKINNGADAKISLDCGIGSIKITVEDGEEN